MTGRRPSPGTLTRNQALVLEALQEAGRAMTAYELLDALRDHGLRAPVQVYRALEALGQRELVHRIETLNAFVACRHLDHRETAAFAICDDCRTIWEFTLPPEAGLTAVADRKGFETRHTTVELHGRCAACCGEAKD
jgi:Fur family zinc uptake transcriptional regulator